MFKNYSWESYWTFIALTVALYYVSLLFIFRIQKSLQASGISKVIWQKSDPTANQIEREPEKEGSVIATSDNDFLTPPRDSEEYPVYACVDEINAYLEEAKKRKGKKDDMIASIRQIVTKYPSIKDSAYKGSLSNVIVSQCEHLCFISLSAEDMNHVWNG